MATDEDVRVIADDNDYTAVVGPVRGINPETAEEDLYHGDDVVGFITDDPESNTPLGGLTDAAPEVGNSGRYVVTLDGEAIAAALAALADNDTVYRVVRSPGNFRRVDALTYRKTLPSDE